jgi:hypothetical protein
MRPWAPDATAYRSWQSDQTPARHYMLRSWV